MLLLLLTNAPEPPGGEGEPYYLEDVVSVYELEDGSGPYVQE